MAISTVLSATVERCNRGTWGPRILPELLENANQTIESESVELRILKPIAQSVPLQFVAIVLGSKGSWRVLHQSGQSTSLPSDWLSEILDAEAAGENRGWFAAPVDPRQQPGLLLVAQGKINLAEFDSLAAAVSMVLRIVRAANVQTRRAARLQALLAVTGTWQRSKSTIELLQQIAETSTKLLQSERATIFLLDPVRQLLVGRPALGVDNDELVIPRDTGVVGQVVNTGLAQRVDTDVASEQALVNRQVDQKLKFTTKSLLCVPLRNDAGQIIGAFELINKLSGNFSDDDQHDLEELAAHAAVAIGNSQHIQKLIESRKQAAQLAAEQVTWIGHSPQIEQVRIIAERVAATDLAVLITGENGTGKEIVAQMIHYLSQRRDQMLVAVNCAAITETLLESELFGHEKGAFTDAHQTRIGKFELADRGTLFLDEIGDMSLAGQAKLLRVLEEKVVVRVGGSIPIPTSARVIAATNQNLGELVQQKKFREDLFFRLNVVTIQVPPLRDRGRDAIELANHFIEKFSALVRRSPPQLTAEAQSRLLAHSWPGNVRELRNLMERLVYLSSSAEISAADLDFVNAPRRETDSSQFDGKSLAEATDAFQKKFITRQIAISHGNIAAAARNMGLHRSNLYRKMRQLGMEIADEQD